MRHVVKLGQIVALGLTVVPAVLVAAGDLTLESHKTLMNVGMLLWFATVVLQTRLERNRA
jgi:hypothetical protein